MISGYAILRAYFSISRASKVNALSLLIYPRSAMCGAKHNLFRLNQYFHIFFLLVHKTNIRRRSKNHLKINYRKRCATVVVVTAVNIYSNLRSAGTTILDNYYTMSILCAMRRQTTSIYMLGDNRTYDALLNILYT